MNTVRTLIYFAARGARRLGCAAVRRSAMTLLVLLLSAATASAMQIFVRTIADKIITLVTCDTRDGNKRIVVLGKEVSIEYLNHGHTKSDV